MAIAEFASASSTESHSVAARCGPSPCPHENLYACDGRRTRCLWQARIPDGRHNAKHWRRLCNGPRHMGPRRPVALTILCAVVSLVGQGCGSSSVSSVTSPSTVQRCQTTVSAPTAAFGANGGTGTATVGAPRECTWTASAQASWISIIPPASGQGDGSLSFRVAENPDPVARQSTIAVSDRSLELSQDAAPCAYAVSPNTDVVGAEGGTLTIDVRTNAACSWTASTDAPWATPSPESGKGALTVRLAVAPNSGPERSARATIASQQLTFSQRSPAPPAPAPAPAPTPPPTPTPIPPPTPAPPVPHPIRHHPLRHRPLRHRPRRYPRRRYPQLRRHRLRHPSSEDGHALRQNQVEFGDVSQRDVRPEGRHRGHDASD